MNKALKQIFRKILSIVTIISPIMNSKIIYRIKTGKKLNLQNPKNFNEKIMYLKLFDYPKNSLISKCTDKYLVRKYLEEKKCEDILNELIGVYDNANEIIFSELPNQFVLKCNHGCGYNIICKNKSNINEKKIKKQLNKWINEKYGLFYSELHYLNIVPKIICEKYLDINKENDVVDYKIYCFNGKPSIILACGVRNGKTVYKNFYSKNWELINIRKDISNFKSKIKKPKCLDKLLVYAEKLSGDFKFVRVDFYIENNKIYFGELTFTPASCCGDYDDDTSVYLGNLINIKK